MNKLITKLFGNKYYLNILNDSQQDYVASTPFTKYGDAMEHKRSLEGNRTIRYVRTVSFRTKEPLSTIKKRTNIYG